MQCASKSNYDHYKESRITSRNELPRVFEVLSASSFTCEGVNEVRCNDCNLIESSSLSVVCLFSAYGEKTTLGVASRWLSCVQSMPSKNG